MATWILLNSIPNDSISDLSKLKAFADDKLRVIQKVKLDSGRVETLWNKSGKLSQDTPVFPQVVKLGHAPDKIQV